MPGELLDLCAPDCPCMELFGDWKLNHRSAESLRILAVRIGANPERVRVGEEKEGLNLFLHIKRGQ